MQFAENLLDTNPVLAAIIITLFFFVDLIIILDITRVCSRYYLPKERRLQQDPPPAETSVKSKLKWLLSIYAMAVAAVAYYFFQFFIWNHRLLTSGIGLLYVAVFILGFTTLLVLASAILNKIRIKYSSKKTLAVNLIVDVALFILLNTLYFGYY